MDEARNPWTTLESGEKYDNPWIRVVEHHAAGMMAHFAVVRRGGHA